jgi:LPS export ABC transporter protein LptC
MINRKKKLKLIQFMLLVLGVLIISFTYLKGKKTSKYNIVSKETQEKIKMQIKDQSEEDNVFFDIEYSGLDLNGNRYILKSERATNSKSNQEIVILETVIAYFYFKDDTVLRVKSKQGVYNNNSLDMTFEGNVEAVYEKSYLSAQKAVFSNSKGFLTISDGVKVKDDKGSISADELLFDITKQTLDIASFNNNKINANVNLE